MGKQSVGKKLLQNKAVALFVLTIVLTIIVTLIKPSFLVRLSVRTLFVNITVPAVMIASVAPLLISGGIDLSASAQASMGAMIFAQVLTAAPTLPWGVALLLALLGGVIFGLINIFLTNVLNFMPFIATIGMSSVYLGFTSMWSGNNNVQIVNPTFNALGTASIGGWVPWLFIFSVAVVAVYVYILTSTRFGRSAYMVGGNPYAARLSGLNPAKIRGLLFINSSVIACLAGVVWAAQKKMASPTNLGTTVMPSMTALTASILGGVAFMGGAGSLIGAFFGMLLLTTFDSALITLGMPNYLNVIAQGLILIAALIIDNVNAVRQQKALKAAAILSEPGKEAKA